MTSRIVEVEALFKLFLKGYQKDNININRKSETPGSFACPKGAVKVNFSPKRFKTLKISDTEP